MAGKKLAGIEYVGITGITKPCVDALLQLLQYRRTVAKACLLTFKNNHGFVLQLENGDPIAIKSGFSSGYSGEGPRGLSLVLELLEAHGAEIEEYEVSEDFVSRLDLSALTQTDFTWLRKAKPVRPYKFYDYISERDLERFDDGTLWKKFRPIIPLGIVDPRLIKLAVSFWNSPDERLMTAYRRLEDIVRERSGISGEQSSRLFSKAFLSEEASLGWPEVEKAEQIGRGNLFVNAYLAHRNPRAHREQANSPDLVSEFLLLNHLYILEREAVPLRKKRSKKKKASDGL